MTPLSEQLEKTLSVYAHQVDANLIAALAKTIRAGTNASFVDEFEAAIRAGAFTPARWGALTRTDLDDDDLAETDQDLRFIWSQVSPDRPYPGDDSAS